MEGNHGQTPAGFQVACGLRQHRAYFFKLTVDENPNGLKRPRRRVLAAFASTDGLCRQLRQLAGCKDGALLPLLHNGARNLAVKPLFTIISDYLANLFFAGLGQPLRGGLAARGIHPHIQRRIVAEAEAAFGIVDLRRRHAQIKQRTVHRFNAQSF